MINLGEISALFAASDRIRLYNDQDQFSPMTSAFGNANVHIGRIRPVDESGHIWNFMVISDNILRGGATNAFEILQSLVNVNE